MEEPKKKRGRPKKIDQVVNSPKHYLTGDVECIDAMVSVFGEEQVRIYAKINAFKYLWRAGKKDDENTDLAKSRWYLQRATGVDPRRSP